MLAGRYTGTTPGWNTSTDEFATAATTNGPDGFDATNGVPRLPANVYTNLANSDDRQRAFAGRPSITYRNRFYYAGNDYTVGTTGPTIRVWDGTTDRLLTRIPPLDSTQASAVLCLIAANQRIYLTTYDTGSYAANSVKARIFELNPESGALVQMGSRFPISPETARVPYGLAWHMGRLWTATFTGGSSATQRSYFIRPGIDTDWTSDSASVGANGPITNMLSFQGQIYFAGTADATSPALMRVRSPAGAYSTSLTVALNEGGAVPTMASFGIFNHFGAMAIFSGNLYAAYFNKDTADANLFSRVYQYTGSAWSVVYSPAANAATSVPFQSALVHNSDLYFLSSPESDGAGTEINKIIKTSDGTTWSDVSSGLANFSTSHLGVIVT